MVAPLDLGAKTLGCVWKKYFRRKTMIKIINVRKSNRILESGNEEQRDITDEGI